MTTGKPKLGRPRGSLKIGCAHSPVTCDACCISRQYEREVKAARLESREKELVYREPYIVDAPF